MTVTFLVVMLFSIYVAGAIVAAFLTKVFVDPYDRSSSFRDWCVDVLVVAAWPLALFGVPAFVIVCWIWESYFPDRHR